MNELQKDARVFELRRRLITRQRERATVEARPSIVRHTLSTLIDGDTML
jgi:hypothetical protein